MPRSIRKILLLTLLLVVLLYLASYTILSIQGGYADRMFISGKLRYTIGLSVPDEYRWQPLGVDRTQHSLPRTIYAPLIALDDMLWHKPISVEQLLSEHFGDYLEKEKSP